MVPGEHFVLKDIPFYTEVREYTALGVLPLGDPPLDNGDFCMFLWCAHDLYGMHIFLLQSLSEGFDFIDLGHLNSGSSRIIGSNFSYVKERGVCVIGGRHSSCPLLDDLGWFNVLKLLVASLLAIWPAIRTCYVVARTSSSSVEYLFARRNKSSMDVGGFLVRDLKKGVPGHMLRLKI